MASAAKSRRPPTSEGALLVPAKTRPKHHPQVSHSAADPSVLRPSINVSITGMRQAVKALENGSMEIKSYLLEECNVIYECRTCFNMFRSLANYVAHKRSYCRVRLQDVRHVYRRDPGEFSLATDEEEATTAFVQPEAVETLIPEKEWDLAEYSPSLELLKEAGLIQEIEARPLVTSLLRRPKLDHVVNKLKQRLDAGPEADFYKSKESYHNVRLERITQTSQAVFQTLGASNHASSMGERYIELQKLKQRPCVFLGPDGSVVEPGQPPQQLSSLHAAATAGENMRLPCPLCDKEFVHGKGLSRHLIKKHEKTSEEAHVLLKKAKKTASLNQHKSVFGNIKFGESSRAFQGANGEGLSTACKKCSRVFRTFSDRLCHEITCLPQPKVRLTRLDLSGLEASGPKVCVKLEKLPGSVIEKVLHSTNDRRVVDEVVVTDSEEVVTGQRKEGLVCSSSHSVLASMRPKAESGFQAVLDEDDFDEVTFKKVNEDKDSGIGNGNASEESNDEPEVVEDAVLPTLKRKRRRLSGPSSGSEGSTRGVGKKAEEESPPSKRGLITSFFHRAEKSKESNARRPHSPSKMMRYKGGK